MSSNRTSLPLVVGVAVLLLAASAGAQNIRDMQLFAKPDFSPYGSGPRPREGYFFTFDGLNWSISTPSPAAIGFPNLTRNVFHTPSIQEVQHNTHDTGPLVADFVYGNRIEFGRISNRHGWMFGINRLNNQSQEFLATDVDVVFQDIAFGSQGGRHLQGWVADMVGYLGNEAVYALPFLLADLPISFDEMLVSNRVETWGVELMAMHRLRPTHRGGIFEIFAGVRYMQFDDTFRVDARGNEKVTVDGTPYEDIVNSRWVYDHGPDSDPTDSTDAARVGPGIVLADSNWQSDAENHVVGPQIGARWHKKTGPLTLSAEGRFFAGFNTQNIRNQGVLGSDLNAPSPWNWEVTAVNQVPGFPDIIEGATPEQLYMPILREPYRFDNTSHFGEWSPAAEFRAELVYHVTRAFSVKAGWTGFWMDGIARGSDMFDYTISEHRVMGVNAANNRQNVFMHGWNVGIVINR